MPTALQFTIGNESSAPGKGLIAAGSTGSLQGTFAKVGQPVVGALVGQSPGELWHAALQQQSSSDGLSKSGPDQSVAVMNDSRNAENVPAQTLNSSDVKPGTAGKMSSAFSGNLKPDLQRPLHSSVSLSTMVQARYEKPLVKDAPAKTPTHQSDSTLPSTTSQLPVAVISPSLVEVPLKAQLHADLAQLKEQTAKSEENGDSVSLTQYGFSLDGSMQRAQETMPGFSADSACDAQVLQPIAASPVDRKAVVQHEVFEGAQRIASAEVTAMDFANDKKQGKSPIQPAANGLAIRSETSDVNGAASQKSIEDESSLKLAHHVLVEAHTVNPIQAKTGIAQITDLHAAADSGQVGAKNTHVNSVIEIAQTGSVQAELSQPMGRLNQARSSEYHPGTRQRQIAVPSETGAEIFPVHAHSTARQLETKPVATAAKSVETAQVHKENTNGRGTLMHVTATSEQPEQPEQADKGSTTPLQSQAGNIVAAANHTPIAAKPGPPLEVSNTAVANAGMKSETPASVLATQLQQLHVKSGGSSVETAVNDEVHGRIEVSASRTSEGVAATLKLGAKQGASEAVTGLETRTEVGNSGVSVTGLKEFLSVNQTPVSSLHLEQLEPTKSQMGFSADSGAGLTDLGSGHAESQQRDSEGANGMNVSTSLPTDNRQQMSVPEESATAASIYSGRMVSVMA